MQRQQLFKSYANHKWHNIQHITFTKPFSVSSKGWIISFACWFSASIFAWTATHAVRKFTLSFPAGVSSVECDTCSRLREVREIQSCLEPGCGPEGEASFLFPALKHLLVLLVLALGGDGLFLQLFTSAMHSWNTSRVNSSSVSLIKTRCCSHSLHTLDCKLSEIPAGVHRQTRHNHVGGREATEANTTGSDRSWHRLETWPASHCYTNTYGGTCMSVHCGDFFTWLGNFSTRTKMAASFLAVLFVVFVWDSTRS